MDGNLTNLLKSDKQKPFFNLVLHTKQRNSSSKMNLVFLYRYCSLAVTSIFYLLGSQSYLFLKIVVVVLLGVAAWMITELQRRQLGNHNLLKLTVLAETIGLTLVLVLIGGISSPFIWYALSPVLIAASFLTPIFYLSALTFYLGSTTFIANGSFRIDNVLLLIGEKSYFYLVCILASLLALLVSRLTKELAFKAALVQEHQEELLRLKNKTMIETNEKSKRSLEQIMTVYRLMANFTSEEGLDEVLEEITTSLLEGTQSEAAFIWLTDLDQQTNYIVNATKNREIEIDLMKDWNNIRSKRKSFVARVNEESYLMIVIRGTNHIGVLGVEVPSSSDSSQTFFRNRSFEFLAELSELWLERIHMEQMKEQMLVIAERNRIANEIHDSVSQRLFGIVCALHSLQVKSRNMTWEQMNQEYQFLSQSANTTMKELRAAIYHLSSMKKGEKPFLSRLKKYLDEFAKLNDLSIDYQITGDEAEISDKLKRALYRIICEACGNAVRHGECNHIDLRLSFQDEKTDLVIRDDGVGIHSNKEVGKEENGIGLLNMKSIVNSFTGTFSIDGINGLGTEIQIEIPNVKIQNQGVAG